MITLALEFSSPRRSAAVLRMSQGGEPPTILSETSDEGARAVTPIQLVETVLARADLMPDAIECLVVGLGPGSYTGIRSAIALVQGWQLARPVPALGISTGQCLAEQARAKGWQGRVYVAIDAQRSELYLAGFAVQAAGCREIEALHLAPLAEAAALAKKAGSSTEALPSSGGRPVEVATYLVGPEVHRWFPEGRVLIPEASVLGRLAQDRHDFVSGEKLEPIYLRQTSFVKAPPPREFS